MYEQLGISKNTIDIVNKTEGILTDLFKQVDSVCEYNSLKVISAFQKNKVSEVHFNSTTGYGYNDIGRDTIESVFSDIFKAEDSLVRNQFISGTHALKVTLFALLRPNDVLLSITGRPYDTLHEAIGIRENDSSLKSFGVKYEEVSLVDDDFDYDKIKEVITSTKIKVIEIQRSKGYSTRKSISIDKLEKVISFIKNIDKNIIIMIDNCYCEFVDTREPIEVGADIIVGSLIKNLGGGIAQNGAYISGRKDLIKLASENLTVPGEGKEVGPSLGANRFLLQGLYMAPNAVASSLKTAILASKILEDMGYIVEPKYNDKRIDIVQTIEFNNEHKLIKYCQGIQSASAIDSFVLPIPDAMPGYKDKVIMASGSFVQGSSIELSCDGPIRPPYVAYMQGGLTYQYGKLGVMKAIENISK